MTGNRRDLVLASPTFEAESHRRWRAATRTLPFYRPSGCRPAPRGRGRRSGSVATDDFQILEDVLERRVLHIEYATSLQLAPGIELEMA